MVGVVSVLTLLSGALKGWPVMIGGAMVIVMQPLMLKDMDTTLVKASYATSKMKSIA